MRRKKAIKVSKAAKFLLFAGIAGTIIFAALIAIDISISRQEEANNASLSAFYVQEIK